VPPPSTRTIPGQCSKEPPTCSVLIRHVFPGVGKTSFLIVGAQPHQPLCSVVHTNAPCCPWYWSRPVLDDGGRWARQFSPLKDRQPARRSVGRATLRRTSSSSVSDGLPRRPPPATHETKPKICAAAPGAGGHSVSSHCIFATQPHTRCIRAASVHTAAALECCC